MVDSGASISISISNTSTGMQLTGKSDKQVKAADGAKLAATNTAMWPTSALSKGARQSYIIPGVEEPLISVPVLSNNGYTTVFLPGQEGVNIYQKDDVTIMEKAPPVLQGCRDERGLWYVPVADEPNIDPSPNIVESAMNVYELPSTKEVVRWMHAALGYPTKSTLLTAAKHGNLVTFPGMTPENISKHFPESEEPQKGHMKQMRQGVRSTKVIDDKMR
jgi:hypothetical protein